MHMLFYVGVCHNLYTYANVSIRWHVVAMYISNIIMLRELADVDVDQLGCVCHVRS